ASRFTGLLSFQPGLVAWLPHAASAQPPTTSKAKTPRSMPEKVTASRLRGSRIDALVSSGSRFHPRCRPLTPSRPRASARSVIGKRPKCVECHIELPDTHSDESLVSRFGWRLTRTADAPGIEWRCPACWKAFKERKAPK